MHEAPTREEAVSRVAPAVGEAIMSDIPGAVRAALDSPALARRSWQDAIAPQFIALFLWVAFFDQLPKHTLSVGGLIWSAAGAAAAAVLCNLLLFHVPAMWGWQVGRPLPAVASRTFGLRGSGWLAGTAFGLAQVVVASIATAYASDLCLKGMIPLGLLEPNALRPWVVSRSTVPSVLLLITSFCWALSAWLVGHYLVRVIGALMRVFPIFLAGLLGLAMILTARGLREAPPVPLGAATSGAGPRAFLTMIQWVFGFFALAGFGAADWGAAARERRDVRLGGWVGVAFASWTVATLALLIVAGSLGIRGSGLNPASSSLDVQEAVVSALPAKVAAAFLIGFGLASLAPTVYASFLFGHRLASAWPRVKRMRWTLLGTLASWLLIVAGLPAHPATVFAVFGAVFAPAVGAMAADYGRSRGEWAGPRAGVNRAGLLAWAAGLSVGLVPVIAEAWGIEPGMRFQPASLYAFLTAYVAYRLLAGLGLESGPAAFPPMAEGLEATAGSVTTG